MPSLHPVIDSVPERGYSTSFSYLAQAPSGVVPTGTTAVHSVDQLGTLYGVGGHVYHTQAQSGISRGIGRIAPAHCFVLEFSIV